MEETIKIIPKLDNITKKSLNDYNIGFFVDTSGSTSGKILTNEINFVNGIHYPRAIVSWNNIANVCNGTIVSDGLTEPQCIFRNINCANIYDKSNIIFFTTDGEIMQRDITIFANEIKNKLNKDLIVCILFGNNVNSDPNISVFAPFLEAKNLLILNFESLEQIKILHTIGEISKQFQKNNYCSTKDINKLYIINNYPNIPIDYTFISENEHEIKVINIEKLLKSNINDIKLNITDINKITIEEWDSIIKIAKTRNLLPNIRSHIDRFRNKAITEATKNIINNTTTTNIERKKFLISQIMNCNDETIKIQLQNELREIIPIARIDELNINKNIKEQLHDLNSYWENIRFMLHHYEGASYSLSAMTGLANRAKRSPFIEQTDLLTPIIYTENVPQIECSIHCDNGPFVLWLNKPENLELTMNDHIMTFPLDYVKELQKCIVLNPVCGDCAQSYLDYAKNQSVYRENISGYIPINITDNKIYVKSQLCKILCDEKSLNHVEMLLLSMIDDTNYPWIDENIKNYLKNELIKNIITTDTLSEDGTRMSLGNAIMNLTTEKLIRQPFIASFRLIKYLTERGQSPLIKLMAQEKLAFRMIENILNIFLKNNKDGIMNYINNKIFTTICDIPIIDYGIKFSEIINFRELCNEDMFNKFISIINYISSLLHINSNELLSPQFLTLLLYSLKTISNHERPLTTYMAMANNKLYKEAFDAENVNSAKNKIENDLIGNYYECYNYGIPPYACYLKGQSAPSKLFFNGIPLLENTITYIHDIESLSNILQTKLKIMLQQNYGNTYPNEISSHINAHRIVAQVLEHKFPNETIVNDNMYIACLNELKKTNGKKGNMYKKRSIESIILCVNDFIRIRNESEKINEEIGDKRYIIKLKKELENLEITDTIDYSKINIPIDLKITYNYLNIDEIIVRIKNDIIFSNNNKMIELKFDNVFEINIPLEQQNKEQWIKEQEDIVKHAILHDTIDITKIKTIAGMDVSFHKTDSAKAVASMVVFDAQTMDIIAKASIKCQTNIKYIPTFLAFREVPIFIKLYELLKEVIGKIDIIIIDGNGIYHPRRCGCATHFGVLTNNITIGVSKNILNVDNINFDTMDELMKNTNAGEMKNIITYKGEILGKAFNVTGTPKNSIYISVGNGISLNSASQIIKNATIHHITEPIRQADLLSRELLESWN